MRVTRPARRLAAILLGTAAGIACSAEALDSRSATNNLNYAFASELGSGVYDLDGRIMQVYRLPLWWNLRDPQDDRPGIRLVMPTTFGFFDFTSRDVLEFDLPSSIGSFSIMPGVELDYLWRKDWHFIPYLQAGLSVADDAENAGLLSTGMRLQRTRQRGTLQTIRLHELSVALAYYQSSTPDDWFVRLRQGIEWRHVRPTVAGRRTWVPGAYVVLDLVPDPPHIVEDASAGIVQFEAGFTLGLNPMPTFLGYDWPKIGLGYRLAGDLPGWRLVIGGAF